VSVVVLDAYGLFTYLERESGYAQVKAHLERAATSGRNLLLCVVNWGEVYYTFTRESGRDKAEDIKRIIETLPIEVVPADLSLTRQAALYKASYKMSYADCFAAALAKTRQATLVTGDKDFKQVEGEVNVHWL